MAAKHFAAALLEGWPIDGGRETDGGREGNGNWTKMMAFFLMDVCPIVAGELLSEMDPKEVNCLLSAEQPARHLLFSRLRADQIAKLVKVFIGNSKRPQN